MEWLVAVTRLCKSYKLPRDMRNMVREYYIATTGWSCHCIGGYCGDHCPACAIMFRGTTKCVDAWRDIKVSREWRNKRTKLY